MAADTNAVLQAIQKNTGFVNESSSALSGIYAAMEAEASKVADATARGTSGGKTPLQVRTEMLADLEAQNQVQKVAAAADWENMSVMLATDLRELTLKQRQVAAQIAEDKSVSLFEDPFTAITNAFTLPWDEQELQGVHEQIALTSDAMSKINNQIQQSAQTANLIKNKITLASIDDVAAATQADIDAKAAKARFDALALGVHEIKDLVQMDSIALNNTIKMYEVLDRADEQAWRREQRAAHKKALDKALKAEEIENQILDDVNFALIKSGKQPIPEAEKEKVKVYLKSPGKLGDLYRSLAERGGLAKQSAGIMSHGETITEASAFRKSIGYVPKTKQEDIILTAVEQAIGAAQKAGVKDKTGLDTEAKKLFDNTFDAWQSNVKVGDKENPLQPAAWSTVALNPKITTMPAWQKVIAPTITDNIKDQAVDPQILMDRLAAAVVAKQIKPAEATTLITSIANYSMAMNNSNLHLADVSGRTQTKFGTRIEVDVPGMPQPVGTIIEKFSAKRINLADPVQVQEMLATQVRARLGVNINWMGEYPEGGSAGFYPPLTKSGVLLPKEPKAKETK